MGNKMAEMKDNTMRVKLLPVVGCVLMVLVCAAPCSAETIDWLEVKDGAEFNIGSGPDCDYESATYITVVNGTVNLLEGAVVYGVEVDEQGTVNMSPGAYVDWFIYAYGGGKINIYGGDVGFGIWILGDDPQPTVTVYGKYFELVEGTPYTADSFIPEAGMMTVLTVIYENDDDPTYLEFYGRDTVPVYLVNSTPEVTEVAIDIKPGSDTNPINLKSKGLVPVAVLTAKGFVASTVDPQTVLLEGVKPVRWTLEDVDGDGDKDMLFHFKTEDLAKVLTQDSTKATLTGQTTGEASIQGTDVVQIVPSKSK